MIDWVTRIHNVMNILYETTEGFHVIIEDETAWIYLRDMRIGFDKEIVENSSGLAILYEVMEYSSP